MPEYFSNKISHAVFQTLMYSDVFNYPLTAREAHYFLHGILATYEQVVEVLNEDPRITNINAYYVLTGHEEIVNIRKQRESYARKLIPHALNYGKILGSLPFVRMVALTGSLAVMNVSKNADFDYMIVTAPGRLWMARAFVLLFGRMTKVLGHTICPNLIVSQNMLGWQPRDLYSARELCQMIPISGMDVYEELLHTNEWVQVFLPNAYRELINGFGKSQQSHRPWFQRFVEFLLHGHLGHHFEQWEMNRKVERFTRQDGFGEETIFNAEICQGNFDHHRKWTQKEVEQRLKTAGVVVKAL